MAFDPNELRFLQRLVRDRPERTAMSKVAAWFTEHHGMGVSFARHIEYQANHHAMAEHLLRAHELPVAALAPGSSRADAALYPGLSEKTQSRPPMSDGVAMKTIGRANVAGWQGGGLAGSYVVGTVEQASAVEADRVMVVENLETFRWLEDYRWIPAGGHRILVLYRGDRGMSLRDSTQVLSARKEPVWAFSDFDPAGLGLANAVLRLERVVLPSPEWLASAARGARSVELFESSRPQYEAQLTRSNDSCRGRVGLGADEGAARRCVAGGDEECGPLSHAHGLGGPRSGRTARCAASSHNAGWLQVDRRSAPTATPRSDRHGRRCCISSGLRWPHP